MSTLGERLRQARGEISRRRLADLIGKTATTIQRWEGDENQPAQTDLEVVAQVLRVNRKWIETGRGPKERPDRTEVEVETFDPTLNPVREPTGRYTTPDGSILVPVYDVEAAAGEGFFNAEEAIHSHQPFERSELTKRGISPSEVAAVYVAGNSMQGRIDPGEIVFFVRQADNRIVSDAVYLIRLGEAALIKRLVAQKPGKLLAVSDNKDVDPFEINTKDEWLDFQIIGRVFASIKWH